MGISRLLPVPLPLRRSRPGDGFIIVAALWILMMLATLASIYSIYLANSALAVSANDAGIETESLVSAGVELAAYQLSAAPKDTRPTHGEFRIRLGRANVAVKYSSEAARIDLNAGPKSLLSGLFAALGARNQDADRYADRVVGWRTEQKPESQNDEDQLYRAAGLPYSPRGAPFAHVSELWLVQGLPPALVQRALRFVTVYSGRSTVNVRDAAPEVIAALPDMTPERLDGILNRRDAPSGVAQSAADVLGTDEAGATTAGSDAFRIEVRIAFDNGLRTVSEAVILVRGDDVPFHVLTWRDDIDPAPASQFTAGAR